MSNTRVSISLSAPQEAEVAYMEITTKSKVEARRCRIVLLRHRGQKVAAIAQWLGCGRKAVYTACHRYLAQGVAGLRDERLYKGATKATAAVRKRLMGYLDTTPREHGWQRPTWTLELFARQLGADLGVTLSPSHLGRVLKQERCRRGRPRPVPKSDRPDPRQAVVRVQLMVARAAPACEVFFVDEADLHLNPKLGLMWMKRGQQVEIPTPGQDVRYHLAGALNARTGTLTYVHGMSKNAALFIDLLETLVERYRRSSILHLILDNYRVHTAQAVQRVLARLNGRVALHFLSPYCPEPNRIERLWKQLHDEVTRNHRHTSMQSLWRDVVHFLECVQPFPGTQTSTRRLVA
jgi:transposase